MRIVLLSSISPSFESNHAFATSEWSALAVIKQDDQIFDIGCKPNDSKFPKTLLQSELCIGAGIPTKCNFIPLWDVLTLTSGNGIRDSSIPSFIESVIIETFSPERPVCTGFDTSTVSLSVMVML
jgi:hypothetical protein